MSKLFRAMAICMAAGALAIPAQAETLTDAMIAAYRNSHLLEKNQALLRAADEDVAIAVANLRPVISYVLNWGFNGTDAKISSGQRVWTKTYSTSASLSLDFLLYDGGQRHALLGIANETVLATRQALVMIEQQVLLDAVEAYVNVRLAQEIVTLRQSNMRLITEELEAVQDRFEVGEVTRTDVSIAEASLAGARSDFAAAEGDLEIAREAYKAATGAYPGRLANLPRSPAISRSLEDAQGFARKTHPLVRQGQHLVKVADISVELAAADARPVIGIGGKLTPRFGSGSSYSADIGLNMSQTIYSGGKTAALRRQALAQKEVSRAELRQTVVDVEHQLGVAWASLDVARASITASELQISAAQDAFEGVRDEAELGVRTTLDVLDAEQTLLSARVTSVEARANQEVAVYRILAAMGLMTVDHLQLGIPTYDPRIYYNAVKNAPSRSAEGKKLDTLLKRYDR